MSYGMEVPSPAGAFPPPRQRGASGTMIQGSSLTADYQLLQGSGGLLFWNAVETTGTAAGKIALYDGESIGGQLISQINLASAGEDTEPLIPDGLPVERGIFVHVISGSVQLAVCFAFDPPAGYQ